MVEKPAPCLHPWDSKFLAQTQGMESESGAGKRLGSAVFLRECLVAHRQIDNALDEADNCGNERPAKQKVQDALPCLSKIEFVYSDPTRRQNREQSGCEFVPAIGGRHNIRSYRLPHAALGTNFCLCTDDSTTFMAEFFICSLLCGWRI